MKSEMESNGNFCIRQTAEYFFMKVSLETDRPMSIPIAMMKMHILKALGSLYGQVGQSIDVSIIKYEEASHRMILRIPASGFNRVWSALSLCSSLGTVPCVFRIHQVSGSLLGLSANSRDYDFHEAS
ncbi:hypothetical protein CAPTEDRAFT_219067 [Capitella teleta]|uniref:Uncharacterized protein n=1 Tax=Capitella teleta TaxID=283909 RepID=R7UDK2_CAPTE|nr:hypothetical protein CAPTEDRAFT_219067 [Capitella teleta]|eukprot:ELU04445.1 hypothetical protein CAPTEDRAFT_219067 [Capitella teleta]